MGRTLPTQIQLLKGEEDAWKHYRRALRIEDQMAFDQVWALARKQSAASSMASRALPFESYLLSMVVGLQRQINELKNELSRRPVTLSSSDKPA